MKFFGQLFLVSLLITQLSCETSNETTSGNNVEVPADAPEAPESQRASISYSGSGLIGTYPVSWEVNTSGEVFTGSYQYEGQEASLLLSGESHQGKSLITESDSDGNSTGTIELEAFPSPIWRGTWSNPENGDQHSLTWTANKAVIHSPTEGWPVEGFSLNAKEVSLYTPDSLCHVTHRVWRAVGNSPIARAFNSVTQPPSFQNRKVGLTDCMISIEEMEGLERFPASGEESSVRLGQLVGDILPINFDLYSYAAGTPHPNYGSETVHLLLPDLQEISLPQLFKDGFRSLLDEKVKAGLEKQFGTASGLEYTGLPDEFNYELQPDQMVIYFNPYEIGPYALGTIQIGIAYQEIEEVIREDGPLASKK